jgi:protein-disulfide isomerase
VLGLDADRVAAELVSGAHGARVQRAADSAHALGSSSTPAFFVNGELHTDSYDAGSLVAALKDPA